jgi:hypothetical protein
MSSNMGPAFTMTVTTARATTSRGPACDFQVFGTVPAGHEEIAILTSSGPRKYDPTHFKELVRADVCRVGGDAVVTEVNADGAYVRAMVLRPVGSAGVTPGAPSAAGAQPTTP